MDGPSIGRGYILELENGSTFSGRSFGADQPVAGEVVFNTAMSGYVQSLTDPSYRGQILVLTYPLVGNYGVPAPRRPGSIDDDYESDRIQASGLVVQSYSRCFSHHRAQRSLGDWLTAEDVPGITGVDTRTLTRLLREHGTMQGCLYPEGADPTTIRTSARRVEMHRQAFLDVAPREPVEYPGGDLRIVLVDCGAKDHIVRSLLSRGATVVRVPWHADLEPHCLRADGVLIGNGPGDPADLAELAAKLRRLLDRHHGPVFGVCLGHQLLAMAAGARTYKLPYGHRGINQPVRDLGTGRCFVTSQNHGYAVDESSLPPGWRPWFVNLNDGTNEGLRADGRPHFSVQFHPEASPGPEDTRHLFDEFLALAGQLKRPR